MTSSKALSWFSAAAFTLLIMPACAYSQDASPADGAPAQHEERPDITLSEDALSDYVGAYRLAPNATMSITLDNGALHTQLTGQPTFVLIPESATRFVLQGVDAAIAFERDASGAVTGAVLYQGGRSLRTPRV